MGLFKGVSKAFKGAVGGVLGGLGMLFGALGGLTRGQEQPLLIEQPPQPTTKETAQTDMDAAAIQARKRASGATGRGDTILTGSQGLGEIGSENQRVKSLLGY
jgi:hypothetical protein